MGPKLVACAACACYVNATETECPHCDAPMERGPGGRLPATAAALILGLVTVGGSATMSSGCSDSDTAEDDSSGSVAPAYGVPETVGGGDMSQGGMGGNSAVGGAAPAYGVPETTGNGGGGIGGGGGAGGMRHQVLGCRRLTGTDV